MTRPLRILQVTDLYDPFIGGMESHVKALSHGLAGRGHEVTIATAHLPGTAIDEVVDGLSIRRISGWTNRALHGSYERAEAPYQPPLPDPGVMRALREIIEDVRPDVVHTQGWISYSCMAMPKRRQYQLVVTMHDYSFTCARRTLLRNGLAECAGPRLDICLRCAPGQYGKLKGTALTVGLRTARSLHHRVDSWVAASQSVADASRCSLPRTTVVSVIPSASPDVPADGPRPEWLPDGDFLLFVGALGHHKGLNWLLDAHSGGGLSWPLVVIGASRHDAPQSWPPGVTVITDVAHQAVMAAWRHAGIGLVPSLCREGFGLVAVEAMRSGVPVVASRIGALPEIVADDVTGLLVTPGNTPELLRAIRRLEEDSELRRAMGAAGRVRSRQFSAETVTEKYEQHYRRILGVPSQACPGSSTLNEAERRAAGD
jgi:glycosyltransferase involved in cell wall biosynthesis